jgi:hypothetical protein
MISKNGHALSSLEDWQKHAGPKSKGHWREGRSAMESARFWLGTQSPRMPDVVGTLLEGHSAFGPVLEWSAEPEAKMRLDGFRGEPRNADLLIKARDAHGDYLIAVEAKADETFGETVGDALGAAVDRKLENSRSNGVARIEQLASAMFGPQQEDELPLARIRYQLMTAVGSALYVAAKSSHARVLVLIQEFQTSHTTPELQGENAHDLRGFVRRLSHGAQREVKEGVILGPFPVPGRPLVSDDLTVPDLYMAKIKCKVAQSGPA